MQIDLNKAEIELIDKALETWERDAQSSALMSGVFSGMLTRREKLDETRAEFIAEMNTAQKETQARRIKSVLLRAKLYQALSRESEHAIGDAKV